jgi:peptide/nickel transport system ATP-binding protein/oligopeptide transport system ATP-binding protein
LLEIRNLKKYYPVRSGVFSRVSAWVKAVDDVSFSIQPQETFGLVGESGCGKTTVGRTLLRLIEPTAGRVFFDGQDFCQLNAAQVRAIRRRMQMIFQDPYSSLNPRMTVGAIIGEALKVHNLAQGDGLAQQVTSLLERVGLSPTYHSRYPHEFSGGQRQRIGIARALALSPQFIVCDEPVSALDVSIQAQILNLLQDLQQNLGLSYLFISHDLNVVEHIADRVAVMYLGKLVEVAPVDELFRSPQHPYTLALMSANPIPDPTIRTERTVLTGDVPSALNSPAGCPFHTRCPRVMEHCKTTPPPRVQSGHGEGKHLVWCHLYEEETAE